MGKLTETKQKLLETATRLIWQSNYDRVGVAEICKQAGVTKGTFYHYFETKADLFYEASMAYWREIQEELDDLFSPRYEPHEQLELLLQMITERDEEMSDLTDNPVPACPFFTSGAMAGVGEDKVRQAGMEMADNAVKYNIALIRNLKATGALVGDPDVAQLARLFHQYIHGLITYGRVYASMEAIERDLRQGVYRLLGLKEEYWATPKETTEATTA